MFESFVSHIAHAAAGRERFQDNMDSASMMASMTAMEMIIFWFYFIIVLVIFLAIFSWLWNNALVPSISVLKPVTLMRAFGILIFMMLFVDRS